MRLFFPQSALDRWVEGGEATLEGDVLRRGDAVYRLVSGVHFRGTDGGGTDTAQLVGRVKDAHQLATMGVEVIAESAVLGDVAYIVTPGYLGLLGGAVAQQTPGGNSGGAEPVSDEEAKLLSQFLLEKA